MVIDWHNTQEGPPGLDWGMSALILAQVAVGTAAEVAEARAVLTALLRHLDPAVDLGDGDTGCLTQAKKRRAADPAMSGNEAHILDDAMELVLELKPARA